MAGNPLTRAPLAMLATLALTIAACTASGSSPSADDGSMGMESMHADESMHMDEVHFGEPADAANADRVIDITGHDDFTWDPSSIEIAVGETVTFRITNEGAIPHDFTLGDEHMQDEHEEEMQSGMAHMGDEPNAFVLEPGETKEMTWTFTQTGEVLYGCHQAGHYVAGMVGTISVN